MNKSILVIDTPKSCIECKYNLNVGHRNMCALNEKIEEVYHTRKRHQQCPLQDTTELLEALESLNNIGVSDGEGGFYNPIQFHKKKEYNKLYKALGGE